MNRHEYFQQKIAGLNPEMADALAYRMNLQEMCDAAMFPGAYRRTLRLAVDAFPEWFLEDLYVSEVTDETGRLKAPYVVPFRDWAVSITQEAMRDTPDLEAAGHAAAKAAVERTISRLRQDDGGMRP
jgi:hypothetical protein